LVYPGINVLELIGREKMRESKFFEEVMAEGRIEKGREVVLEALQVRYGSDAVAEFKDVLAGDLPLLYRVVTVPASAPAGEVRIRVEKTGMAYVFSTSATRAVMIAPEGFQVGGGYQGSRAGIVAGGGWDDRGHFRVPEEAARFRVATNGVERPTIREPQGAAVPLTLLDSGCYEIAVPKDAAGRLWSVSAGGALDVRFADIQPMFANRDPALYFEPAGVQTPTDVPPAAEPGKSQPRPPARGTSPRRRQP
jgi:hypothetical protein